MPVFVCPTIPAAQPLTILPQSLNLAVDKWTHVLACFGTKALASFLILIFFRDEAVLGKMGILTTKTKSIICPVNRRKMAYEAKGLRSQSQVEFGGVIYTN